MSRMRLDKLLTHLGCGSRREVGGFMRAGRVCVCGAVCHDAARKIDPETDEVTLDGQILQYARHRYYMLNKPAGVITATQDKRQQTVLALFPEAARRDLFAVGRLDKDTEGLLLLTTDGAFGHALMAPKKHVGKRYEALVEGALAGDAAQRFAAGLVLADETVCRPAELQVFETEGVRTRVQVLIYEGKYHQVKRMLHMVGGVVVALRRLQIGAVQLDSALALGAYRELTQRELALLYPPADDGNK